MTVELEITQDPLPAEDSPVTAKITRNSIGIKGSFNVTVTARPLQDRVSLRSDQQRAFPDWGYIYNWYCCFIEVFLIRFYIW